MKYDENCNNCKVFYMVNGHYMNNKCCLHIKKFRCLNCNKGYSHKCTLIDHTKKNNCSSVTTHCYYCNCKVKSINNHICKYIKIMRQLNSDILNNIKPPIAKDETEFNQIDSLLFDDSENEDVTVDVKPTLKFIISKIEFNQIDSLLFDDSENGLDSIYSVKLIN